MIRVERHQIGYRVDADGLSGADLYDLDCRAVGRSIDRYLAHRELLYANPTPALEDTTLWLVYALGRSTRVWPEFHVYFLLARLRLLLARQAQPVQGVAPLDDAVEGAIADLCAEHEVQYRSDSDEETPTDTRNWVRCPIPAFHRGLLERVVGLADRLRLWVVVFLFLAVRPVVLKLYAFARRSVDVRFWLHPVEPHRDRFFDAPGDLNSRDNTIGYALYDVVAVSGVWSFVTRGLRTIRTAFDTDAPVHVEWYADPSELRAALWATPRLREEIRRAGRELGQPADSPEFTYLTGQVEGVSTELVFHLLFIELAVDGFAETVDDDTWTHPRSPTKLTSRVTALFAGEQNISTVAIAPHYFSETRINIRFTDTEIDGWEANTLPDRCAVFEPRSATTLREQALPADVVVACDKVETEADIPGPDMADRTDEPTSAPPSSSPSPSSLPWSEPSPTPMPAPDPPTGQDSMELLVILDLPRENAELVGALEYAVRDIPDVEIVLKPHPFYPPDDTLLEELPEDAVTVAAPDAPLADLARSCDVCVTIYSTAVFPALVWAKPVVWVPFVSPGHVRMDLIDEVGIRADDREEIATVLDRLLDDEPFYVETARECRLFAARELVPDGSAPSLADVLEEA